MKIKLAATAVLLAVIANAETLRYPQPAYRAEDFIDSIGISGTPAESKPGGRYNYPPEVFLDLGIRYYRAVLKNAVTPKDYPIRVEKYWREYGVRPLMLIDPGKSGEPTNLVRLVKEHAKGAIAQIEGPNECNNKFPPQNLNLKYKGKTDEAAGTLYMNDVYQALKADPETKDIPVVAYTAIFSDYSMARPHDAFDFANMHSYQGYRVPSSSLMPNVTRFNNIYPSGAVIKPFVPTECGYNIESDKSNGTFIRGNPRAQALNIPMLLAEYFRHGIARTYLFAVHNADGYGLLESDQQTKRPSYFAVQSLMHLLNDATWDKQALKWQSREFTPRTLYFEVNADAPGTIHSLTLQKQNGDYYLLIWNEVQNYDHDKRKERNPPPAPVTLNFKTAVKSALLYTQNAEGKYDEATVAIQNNSIKLKVPAAVSILKLTPAVKTDNIPLPPVDKAQIKGTAMENKINLEWQPSKDAKGYFVYRNDMCIATVTHTTYEDQSDWIRPDLGYRWAIQPFDADGNVGPKTEVVVTTPAKKPDLVVTEISSTPPFDQIKPDDKVVFKGMVTNIGNGATPHKVPVSVVFSVNGKVCGWGGDFVGRTLGAGESAVYTANMGPGGWIAEAGTFTVKALVDDVNRVSGELNERNNIMEKTITIGSTAGGVLEATSQPPQWQIDLTQEGTYDWILWGYEDKDAIVRKAGGAQAFSAVRHVAKNGAIGKTGGGKNRFVWNNGTPVTESKSCHWGLWLNGAGNAMEFDVKAGTTLRTLRVYVSATEGAAGRFTASLSDGSASDITCESWSGNLSRASSATPGAFQAVYTVRFKAASDNQTLKVKWQMASEPNQWKAQAILQAATLQ